MGPRAGLDGRGKLRLHRDSIPGAITLRQIYILDTSAKQLRKTAVNVTSVRLSARNSSTPNRRICVKIHTEDLYLKPTHTLQFQLKSEKNFILCYMSTFRISLLPPTSRQTIRYCSAQPSKHTNKVAQHNQANS